MCYKKIFQSVKSSFIKVHFITFHLIFSPIIVCACVPIHRLHEYAPSIPPRRFALLFEHEQSSDHGGDCRRDQEDKPSDVPSARCKAHNEVNTHGDEPEGTDDGIHGLALLFAVLLPFFAKRYSK